MNDELINAYASLVNEKSIKLGKRILTLNSFFFTKLEELITKKQYSFTKM